MASLIAFSSVIELVRCVSARSFLVRNWCGAYLVVRLNELRPFGPNIVCRVMDAHAEARRRYSRGQSADHDRPTLFSVNDCPPRKADVELKRRSTSPSCRIGHPRRRRHRLRLIFLSHASMRASAARSLDRRKVVGAKSLGQFASGKIVKFVMTFQETPCRRTDPGNPYCRERQSSVDDKERRASLMRHEHKREAREQ